MEPTQPSLRCLEPHLWNMNVIGFFRLHPKTSPLKKGLHDTYMVFITALVYLFTLQEVIYAYQVRADMDRLVEVSFILLTHFDTIYKHLVFILRADRLQKVFDVFNGETFNRRLEHHDELIEGTAVAARRLLRAFTGAALFTCLLWGVFPWVDHINDEEVVFPVWFPVIGDILETPVFEYVLTYTTVLKALLGFANTTMDAFFSAVFAICKTQITILRFDLERLHEASLEAAKMSGKSLDVVIDQEFVKCIDLYNSVFDVTNEVQAIFSGAILFQFAVSGWIICMTAYKITDLDPASVEFVSMVMYMTCILTELFLYCYYGNEITIESELLTESTYSMNWLDTRVQFQKNLLIFRERIKRSIKPATGAIITLSLPTFMKILKSSYTFYAVLRETK